MSRLLSNPIVKWIAGVIAALLVGALTGIAAMAIEDHDRLTVLEANERNATELLKEVRQDVKEIIRRLP